MRLLDRYLLCELLVPLGYCVGGFLIFWISFDLFKELEAFQQEKLGVGEIAKYYFVKTPELLVTITPVALLLSLLYALTNHARHHELTAMRAAGVSLWRLCVPYFGVAVFLSVLLQAMNEQWVPDSAELAEQIRKRNTAEQPSVEERQWQGDLNFHNDRENRFWRILSYNVETGEMRDPYVAWRPADGLLRQLLAKRGVWTNGAWTFFNVRHLVPGAAPDSPKVWEQTNVLTVVEFSETPEQIRSEIKVSQLSSARAARRVHLTIAEILNYKRLHPHLRPRDRALLDTQLHARLAAPWTCLIVVLIAIPFGAPSGRRNVFVGVAASIFIGFAYFVLQRIGMALGTGAWVPPLLAAWLPNLLFGGAGVWLTLRVR
jgi:lipopolysaccharide export system permease protein